MIPELGPPKDPAAIENYTVDWSADLDPGETLVTSTFSAFPAAFGDVPLTVVSSQIEPTAELTTDVYLSGGDAGKFFEIVNQVTTTANPRGLTKRFILFVQEV